MIESLFYKIRRCTELGPRGLLSKIYFHTKRAAFIKKYKNKALQSQAAHSWNIISLEHHSRPSFEEFFKQPNKWSMLTELYNNSLFQTYRPHHTALITLAHDSITSQRILLGAPVSKCSWHDDFTSTFRPFKKQTNQNFGTRNASRFYTDISIPSFDHSTVSTYSYDVKAPWERSRFNEFFAVGYAYHTTADNQYADYFYRTLTSWLDENPYLLGINWMCPMDVAIRAINIIWALYFFKDSSSIPQEFWQRVVCSLYDHLIYLDSNWEYSDKPNNHALAELLGLLYLCRFFDELTHSKKRARWATKKLDQQWKQQIQHDGTSYEGSTAYHRLDTEIYLHAMLLTNQKSEIHEKTFRRMSAFLEDIALKEDEIITLGDDDSGKIVTGITIHPTPENMVKTYGNFGLTVIRHNGILMTFRHPLFRHRQPTGHFHQDQLSLTLSIHGQQLLTDPGSYLYTSSPLSRNYFRSYNQHNTLFFDCSCCTASNNLFQLTRPEHMHVPTIIHTNNSVIIHDWYQPCKNNIVTLSRTVVFEKDTCKISITDQVNKNQENIRIFSNFLLYPNITIDQKGSTMSWDRNNLKVATFSSPLQWERKQGFYAPAYGIKHQCIQLRSTLELPQSSTHIVQLNMDRTQSK